MKIALRVNMSCECTVMIISCDVFNNVSLQKDGEGLQANKHGSMGMAIFRLQSLKLSSHKFSKEILVLPDLY